MAWQINGEIPNIDAPKPNDKFKAGKNAKRIQNLVNERRALNASQKADTTHEDLEYIEQTSMRRNYRTHFDNICEWQTAIRIWGSQSISVEEAYRAQDCHDRACRNWARMFCHLTPYFHILIHLIIFILRLGPVYGWWTYPFERFNGWLGKV